MSEKPTLPMPLTQRIVMLVCLLGLAVVTVPLVTPNRCGEIGFRAGMRSKGEIHTSAGERRVRTPDEQQAERDCIGGSRRSLAIAAVAVPVLGTLLMALVAVPAVKRRAWRFAQVAPRNESLHHPVLPAMHSGHQSRSAHNARRVRAGMLHRPHSILPVPGDLDL